MKDVTHHLRHIQKKIIQSSRKEAAETNNTNHQDVEVMSTPMTSKLSEKKFDENHRTPRLLQKPAIY
jgi:hypothetical protein